MNLEIETVKIIQHESGKLLLFTMNEDNAIEVATGLVALLEAELDASIEDNGWRRENRVIANTPTLIRLECLEIELTANGNEVKLLRVDGSEHEFDELCSFIGALE